MPQFGGASEKCSVCSKTVYLAEKIVVEDKEDKKTFHKTCLKCSHCKATLSLGNYASMNGIMYCKPHFKQLFATKGNYDEGFGKEKLTSKWSPNTAASPSSSFVPVDKADEKSQEKKETPSSIASRFQKSSLTSEKCDKCNKAVYATEKIVIEEKEGKKVYHKQCLRCVHCQVVLTLGNYAAMNGVTYCKPHFKQLFATKGNYDEGFGKEKHATKWESSPHSSAPATFVPVEKVDVPKENKSTSSSEVASRFKNISGSDKCSSCGKTVYLTEKVVVEDKEDKKLFHKACLRCSHCQVVLSLGSYASMNGIMYCKPHFKQLFATKGNYDEGFGKEKHSAKWIEQEEKPKEEEPHHAEPHHHEESRHEEPVHHEEHHHEEPRHEEPVHHEEPRHEEPVHHEEQYHEEPVHHEEHHHEEPRHEESHHQHEQHHEEPHHEETHHHHEETHEEPRHEELHHHEEGSHHQHEESHHHDESHHDHHHEESHHDHHDESEQAEV